MPQDKKKSGPFIFRFRDIENSYLGELLRKKRPYYSILIWFTVFLTMAVFCIYQIYQLMVQYYQYASYNLEYNQLAHKYTLPAITICNLNRLNYTKLEESGLYPAYKDWIGNVGIRNSSSDDSEIDTNDELDQEEIYTQYRMEIKHAVIDQLTAFAKEPTDYNDFTLFAYTANGLCMELNDGEQLVQRVNGEIGGLTLTLDAMTDHYLPETEEAGFIVTLRMPNETVLSQEFGFLVSPGKEYHINVRTKTVTRLSEPWGNCQDRKDIFDDQGWLSFKECYLNQMLWMYPKLRHLGCGCYPWYFYQRYIEDPEDSKYEPNIKWKLIRYWTEELPYEYSLNFTDTCEYDDSSYRPNSNQLGTETGVATLKDCAEICKNSSSCRYFLYSGTTNDVLKANECWLYEKGADIGNIKPGVSTDGLVWGDTQCFNMEQCSVSTHAVCQNKIMNALMRVEEEEEEDDDDTGKSKTPPKCHEPCSYSEYQYEISNSDYPTLRYWNNYLSKQITKYESHGDATSNLLKLVFYTDQMSKIYVTQTPSYDIASFIGELGGLTDLFMGLSFFTAYQFIEWIVSKTVRKLIVERRTIDKSDNLHIEDTNV